MKSFLKIYNITTNTERLVKEFEKHIEAPNWTPDGKYLVYNSDGDIFYHEISSGNERLLDTGSVRCNNDHVISSDGKWVAISAEDKAEGSSKIYILPSEGGPTRLITEKEPSYLHGWSPDMSELAYCAERNGEYDIYTIKENGTGETQLTNVPGLNDGPEYSPDGKEIWFNSVRSGNMQLWKMNTDGSNQTQMTFDDMHNWFGHVSPDSKWVVFVSYFPSEVAAGDHPPNKNVKIRMIPSQGGEIKELVSLFGGQGTINVNSWNPESTEFAFVSYKA